MLNQASPGQSDKQQQPGGGEADSAHHTHAGGAQRRLPAGGDPAHHPHHPLHPVQQRHRVPRPPACQHTCALFQPLHLPFLPSQLCNILQSLQVSGNYQLNPKLDHSSNQLLKYFIFSQFLGTLQQLSTGLLQRLAGLVGGVAGREQYTRCSSLQTQATHL